MGRAEKFRCLDNTNVKNLLIFFNSSIIFAQIIENLIISRGPFIMTCLIFVLVMLIYQALSFYFRAMRIQLIIYSQYFMLTLFSVELQIDTYFLIFQQLSIFDTVFFNRNEKNKIVQNILFFGAIVINTYVFLRVGFHNLYFTDLIKALCQSFLLKLLLYHFRQEHDVSLKEIQKLNNQELEPSDPRVGNVECEPQDASKLFKTFDVVPEGIIILEKNGKEDFTIKYSNSAAKYLVDADDHDQMLSELLDLRSVSPKQKSEEHLYKYSFSIQSQQSVKRNSFKIIPKQQSHIKSAFKISQQLILENQSSSQKQEFQFPPVQIIFPGAQTKTENINHPNSPSIHYATQHKKSLDEIDSFHFLLTQIWVQLHTLVKEKILNYQNQPLYYIHESNPFVTNITKYQKKQCLDLKVYSAIHYNKPLLVIILRDVNHKDYIKVLKDYNSQKSKTLSFVSHEFRTPLTCIIQMLEEVIENRNNLNLSDQQLIQSALDNSKYILNLSNDLLDLAQIRAGKFKIRNAIFDLRSLLKECLKMFEIQAMKKNIQLNYYYDMSLPTEIWSDLNRIRQITVNLIGNALKFTLEGSITLRAYQDGVNEICIEVKDTGVGMREEDQPKLFKAFAKIENKEASQMNAQGVGLGLLISNSIATQLNSEQRGLGFRSAYQEGTTFCFLVTNNKSTYIDEIENYEDSRKDIDFDLETKLNDFRRQSQNEKKFILQKNYCACPQILLVEDNQFNVDSFLLKFHRTFKSLVKIDYTITGQLAEQKVQQRFLKQQHICHPYKLIFMDVELPIQNGIVTSKNIKNYYRAMNATVTIVGCSGYAEEKEKKECLQYMDDYIVKPVPKQELERIMTSYFFK
ncbi:unnamed protein product (macronuclear) [Paramecium tetraurelia]|uniref:Uncharacterized protein n=1 Tax=Paramecium tetraurelia TaxID=5888 RepID=A0DXR2_PARTE|nr:uncharacterized protein GSPATT00021453001 [Paramecium tetraurelia]CAK87829.1 unnamed protein product [Paramecium tetraurelia]|eukprot:XP_001455226.1 hypothetical protein (macronuclear) [Paramecium tetraurelia strain d4-2]